MILGLAHQVQNGLLSLVGQIKYQLLQRHFIYTMRVGLVVSTIVLTLITVFLVNERGMIGFGIIGGIAAITVLVFLYNHMEFGVFLLIITTTIAAPPIPRDITTTLLLMIVLTLLWLFRLLLVERSFKSLRPTAVNRIVPLFAVAVIVSFIWSLLYADPQVRYLQNDKFLPRLVTALVMILSPVATLLFGNFLKDIRAIKRVIWYFIGFGAVVVIAQLASFRPPSFINIGGQLPVWVGLFALGQALFNHKLTRWQRLLLFLITAGWAFYQWDRGREWLSGWIPLFMGLGFLVLLRSRLLFALITVIGLVFVLSNTNLLGQLFEQENTVSGETRLEAGNLAIDIANEHFLFGTGPTGYFFYMTVYVGGLFQLSHNNYVDIYAQLGIFGFLIWIILWLSIGWSMWRTYQLTSKEGFEGGLAASLLAVFLITLLIMMLGDWVIPFTYTNSMRGFSYTIWPWLWFGIGIALKEVVATRKLSVSSHADVPVGLSGSN